MSLKNLLERICLINTQIWMLNNYRIKLIPFLIKLNRSTVSNLGNWIKILPKRISKRLIILGMTYLWGQMFLKCLVQQIIYHKRQLIMLVTPRERQLPLTFYLNQRLLINIKAKLKKNWNGLVSIKRIMLFIKKWIIFIKLKL